MKKAALLMSCVAFGFLFSCHRSIPADLGLLKNLDPEMQGIEYKNFFQLHPEYLQDPDASLLATVLSTGKRNLDWLKILNQSRPPENKLSFTSKETTVAYPIDAPMTYNAELVLARFEKTKSEMPGALAQVIFGNGPLPTNLPLSDADFIYWGHEIDAIYQSGSRWLIMKPNLFWLGERSRDDIRGYYFLSHDPQLQQKLEHWNAQSPTDQANLRTWLLNACANSASVRTCTKGLEEKIQTGNVFPYWQTYQAASQSTYDDYFRMQWTRSDITWTSADPDVMRIPFVDPQNAAVMAYLRDNIEDEWKWKTWQLRMDFQSGNSSGMSHLEYQAGTTPHVEVPDTIVMDENQPTTEYLSKWTIRHEFGHILGFPDCYVEFYDVDQKTMVNYQLDPTNLMCSRKGNFKQIHFDELKRVYFKQ